ncbi:MAG: hypothetical protein EOT04_00870 [Candidatus Chaera renei]|uniref:Uncharacterized protein n=1 Tax=Candidatus Chaera renei TaxID=2506947 RepID=A0A4Q0AJS8_9BACT|nr:MAG: hypothetical protein EOT04_00870 [Candidatus Chaera renei]
MAEQARPEQPADDRLKNSYPELTKLLLGSQAALDRALPELAAEEACATLNELNQQVQDLIGRMVCVSGDTYYPNDEPSGDGSGSHAIRVHYQSNFTSEGRFDGLRIVRETSGDYPGVRHVLSYAVAAGQQNYAVGAIEYDVKLFGLSPVERSTMVDISHQAPPDKEILTLLVGRQFLKRLNRICADARAGDSRAYGRLSRLAREALNDMPQGLQLEVVRYLNHYMPPQPHAQYELIGPQAAWTIDCADGTVKSVGIIKASGDSMTAFLKEFIQLPKLTPEDRYYHIDGSVGTVALRAEVLVEDCKNLRECFFLCSDIQSAALIA